jgi:hypothetical protein
VSLNGGGFHTWEIPAEQIERFLVVSSILAVMFADLGHQHYLGLKSLQKLTTLIGRIYFYDLLLANATCNHTQSSYSNRPSLFAL